MIRSVSAAQYAALEPGMSGWGMDGGEVGHRSEPSPSIHISKRKNSMEQVATNAAAVPLDGTSRGNSAAMAARIFLAKKDFKEEWQNSVQFDSKFKKAGRMAKVVLGSAFVIAGRTAALIGGATTGCVIGVLLGLATLPYCCCMHAHIYWNYHYFWHANTYSYTSDNDLAKFGLMCLAPSAAVGTLLTMIGTKTIDSALGNDTSDKKFKERFKEDYKDNQITATVAGVSMAIPGFIAGVVGGIVIAIMALLGKAKGN